MPDDGVKALLLVGGLALIGLGLLVGVAAIVLVVRRRRTAVSEPGEPPRLGDAFAGSTHTVAEERPFALPARLDGGRTPAEAVGPSTRLVPRTPAPAEADGTPFVATPAASQPVARLEAPPTTGSIPATPSAALAVPGPAADPHVAPAASSRRPAWGDLVAPTDVEPTAEHSYTTASFAPPGQLPTHTATVAPLPDATPQPILQPRQPTGDLTSPPFRNPWAGTGPQASAAAVLRSAGEAGEAALQAPDAEASSSAAAAAPDVEPGIPGSVEGPVVEPLPAETSTTPPEPAPTGTVTVLIEPVESVAPAEPQERVAPAEPAGHPEPVGPAVPAEPAAPAPAVATAVPELASGPSPESFPVPLDAPPPAPETRIAAPDVAPGPEEPGDEPEEDRTVLLGRPHRDPWLLVLDTGERIGIPADSVVLGRKPAPVEQGVPGVAIPDATKTLSKVHARLDRSGERWTITDLGSTNGTSVVVPGGREKALSAGGSEAIRGRFLLGETGMILIRNPEA